MFDNRKLIELRNNRGLSQTKVANDLGIGRNAYYKWETGKAEPRDKHLINLANYFEVEASFFEYKPDILEKYLRLTEINKRQLLNKADELYFSQLYTYRVHAQLSAGLGVFYEDNYESDIVFHDREINYDIASYIKGDSMTPKYIDGDVALIERTGFRYDGLVYAVVFNEETFIKKVYVEEDKIRLVSINKKYKDIVADFEDVRVIGIVKDSFTPIEDTRDSVNN